MCKKDSDTVNVAHGYAGQLIAGEMSREYEQLEAGRSSTPSAWSHPPGFVRFALELYSNPSMTAQFRVGDSEFLRAMVHAGFMTKIQNGMRVEYQTNIEALRVYVDALCSVRTPVQRWVMP